jgi:undecaprenyl-diphosphatase
VSAFEAIILGLVQGLTEFLPISSSGHLRIVPALVGWEDPGAGFTAVIQLGTMAAVLLYFRDELSRIAREWVHELRVPFRLRSHEAKLGWFIIIGTIPISIFGFAFRDQIESGARDLYLIGSALIVFSFVMLFAERVGGHERALSELNGRDGLFIGFAQALALVPGVSRSGAALTVARWRGLSRAAAADLSLRAALPVTIGASALKGVRAVRGGVPGGLRGPAAIGAAAACVSALATLPLARSTSWRAIAGYRVALGALALKRLA